MKDYYQSIGQAALAVAREPRAKILVYAEVEDGVISCDVFFLLPAEREVRYRFSTQELRDLVYELWEVGQHPVTPKSWASMRFHIDDGKFDVEYSYPEEIDPAEGLPDRRPRVVAAFFPSLRVDHSRPAG
jgi:hypothetical protein